MTKAILFDFWGTLVENGVFPSPMKQVMRSFRIHMPFGEFAPRFEEVFMLKKYESLNDAFHAVAEEFGCKPPEFVYENLVGLWNKNKLLAKPYEETLEVLEELKKDFKLVLISNSDSFSLREILEKYNMIDLFDEIILSYEVGMLKTDPKMFDLALKKIGLKKKDIVMVGDSMESDIKGAEGAEVRGILIDRRDTREYEDKILSLRDLKNVL